MRKMLSLFCALQLLAVCAGQEERVVKMYNLVCDQINPEFVALNATCRLKAINRHKSVAYMEGWIIKSIGNVSVHMQLFKYYTQFRPFLINIKVNLCSLLEGTVGKSFYLRLFLRNLVNTTNFLHACPFEGYLYARGLWMDVSNQAILQAQLPLGRFLLRVMFYEDLTPDSALYGQISYYADIYTFSKNKRGRGSNNTKGTTHDLWFEPHAYK